MEAKRVTIRLRQRAECGGADMCEDEGGCGFAGQTREVRAGPGGGGGGEDAGFGGERGGGVVADAEAVAVVGAADIETETAVVGLREDGVRGVEDEIGEEDGVAAFVDQETACAESEISCEGSWEAGELLGALHMVKARGEREY